MMVQALQAFGALAYKDKFKRFPDLIVSKVAAEGDYTTIKDGINAMTVDKAFLGIKSGIFTHDGLDFTLPGSAAGRGVRISGAGMGATVIIAPSSGEMPAFYWSDMDFITIENLTFDGNSAERGWHASNTDYRKYDACRIHDTGFYKSQTIQEGLVTFRNVCFRNAPNHGIAATANRILLFDGCVFEKNGGNGIYLDGIDPNMNVWTVFNNCYFYANSLDTSYPLTFDGAYIKNMSNVAKNFVKFQGCFAFDHQTVKTQRYGFKSVDSDYLEFFNVMAVNNGTGGFNLSGTNNRISHCRE